MVATPIKLRLRNLKKFNYLYDLDFLKKVSRE